MFTPSCPFDPLPSAVPFQNAVGLPHPPSCLPEWDGQGGGDLPPFDPTFFWHPPFVKSISIDLQNLLIMSFFGFQYDFNWLIYSFKFECALHTTTVSLNPGKADVVQPRYNTPLSGRQKTSFFVDLIINLNNSIA